MVHNKEGRGGFDYGRGNLPLAFHPLSRVADSGSAAAPSVGGSGEVRDPRRGAAEEVVTPTCKRLNPSKKAHYISSGVSMQPRIPHQTGTVRLMEAHDASEHEGGAQAYNMSCIQPFIYAVPSL